MDLGSSSGKSGIRPFFFLANLAKSSSAKISAAFSEFARFDYTCKFEIFAFGLTLLSFI